MTALRVTDSSFALLVMPLSSPSGQFQAEVQTAAGASSDVRQAWEQPVWASRSCVTVERCCTPSSVRTHTGGLRGVCMCCRCAARPANWSYQAIYTSESPFNLYIQLQSFSTQDSDNIVYAAGTAYTAILWQVVYVDVEIGGESRYCMLVWIDCHIFVDTRRHIQTLVIASLSLRWHQQVNSHISHRCSLSQPARPGSTQTPAGQHNCSVALCAPLCAAFWIHYTERIANI